MGEVEAGSSQSAEESAYLQSLRISGVLGPWGARGGGGGGGQWEVLAGMLVRVEGCFPFNNILHTSLLQKQKWKILLR